MVELYVYSRAAIEIVRPHEVPHIIISITSGPDDQARLRTTRMCRGILRLSFVDAEAPTERFDEATLFSREQATQIWDMVLAHRAELERIVVHCDAGMSRSPAVAAALARVLNEDDASFFAGRYRPNMRVYKVMLDAAPTAGRPRASS